MVAPAEPQEAPGCPASAIPAERLSANTAPPAIAIVRRITTNLHVAGPVRRDRRVEVRHPEAIGSTRRCTRLAGISQAYDKGASCPSPSLVPDRSTSRRFDWIEPCDPLRLRRATGVA